MSEIDELVHISYSASLLHARFVSELLKSKIIDCQNISKCIPESNIVELTVVYHRQQAFVKRIKKYDALINKIHNVMSKLGEPSLYDTEYKMYEALAFFSKSVVKCKHEVCYTQRSIIDLCLEVLPHEFTHPRN